MIRTDIDRGEDSVTLAWYTTLSDVIWAVVQRAFIDSLPEKPLTEEDDDDDDGGGEGFEGEKENEKMKAVEDLCDFLLAGSTSEL